MARKNMIDKLIKKEKIIEQIQLIKGSKTDYITASGKIYKDYGNNMFFPKAIFINKVNGYIYCNITYPEGQKQRRVHRLVAETFLPNPNNCSIVMHKDNNKANPALENLEWGTASKNTLNAYKDGLAKNKSGWDDSQSIHICSFNMGQQLLKIYGSIGEASREIGVTKTTILNQCNHNIKTCPRCGYYFRFLSEYEKNGFIL